MIRLVGIFVAVLLIAGCSSMSKEECVTADWGAIGYEDGAAGRPVSAVSSRRSVCAKKAGVTVDMAAYRAGRDEGLLTYCRPANGYSLGARGGRYNGVCSEGDDEQFVAAFNVGRQLYGYEAAVASISGQIRQAQYDLRDAEHHIAETEVALISPGHSAEERIGLLAELRHLSEEKGNIEIALAALHRDRDRAIADLNAYRDDLAFSGGWRGVLQTTDASF